MTRYEIIERSTFRLVFGLLILLIPYFIQDGYEHVHSEPVLPWRDDPGEWLYVSFVYWLGIVAGIGLSILGLIGFVRLLTLDQ